MLLRRGRELGLYLLIGLENRQLARLFFLENLAVGGCALQLVEHSSVLQEQHPFGIAGAVSVVGVSQEIITLSKGISVLPLMIVLASVVVVCVSADS